LAGTRASPYCTSMLFVASTKPMASTRNTAMPICVSVGGAGIAFTYIRHAELTIVSSPILLIAGGLLVGFGTRLGSGCTSGHGVCGLARLSPRSLVATATFMAVAAVTVYMMRHLIGGL